MARLQFVTRYCMCFVLIHSVMNYSEKLLEKKYRSCRSNKSRTRDRPALRSLDNKRTSSPETALQDSSSLSKEQLYSKQVKGVTSKISTLSHQHKHKYDCATIEQGDLWISGSQCSLSVREPDGQIFTKVSSAVVIETEKKINFNNPICLLSYSLA